MKRQAANVSMPLHSEQQRYSVEIARFPRLTKEQELMLLARAHAGEQVRDEIVLSLQRRIYCLAWRYAHYSSCNHRVVEWADLASIANIVILEQFDTALTKHNPFAYLIRIVRITMIRAINGRTDLIQTYHHTKSIPVLSLDAPLEDGTHLADLLPVEVRLEPPHEGEQTYIPLYQAIATLPTLQRMVVQRYHGFDCAAESLTAISRSLVRRQPKTPHPANAHYHYKLALVKLRHALASAAHSEKEKSVS